MSRSKGVLLTIISASCFGVIPLLAMISYHNGLNPYTFSLFRSVFASIEIFLFLKLKNIDYRVKREQILPLFYASLIGYCLMMVTLSMSYKYLSTGLATTLHFGYPVAVLFGSVVLFKEKVERRKVCALIIAILGIYFLVGFGASANISLIGIIIALASGLFYAFYVLTISYSNIKDLNAFVLAFYISLFNALILFFVSFFTGNMHLNITYIGLISTGLVALLCNLIGMVAFQSGIKIIGPTTATLLSTFEPMTSMIIGLLILGETMAWYDVIGSLLIIISVVIVAFSGGKILKNEKTLAQRE